MGGIDEKAADAGIEEPVASSGLLQVLDTGRDTARVEPQEADVSVDAPRVKRMLTVRSSRVQGRGEEEMKRFHEYEKERKRKRLKVLEEQQLRERSEERPLKVARTEAESRVRGEEYQRQRGEVRFDRG